MLTDPSCEAESHTINSIDADGSSALRPNATERLLEHVRTVANRDRDAD